jgi:hypothetical protein
MICRDFFSSSGASDIGMYDPNLPCANSIDFSASMHDVVELGVLIGLFRIGYPANHSARQSAFPQMPLCYDNSVATCGGFQAAHICMSRSGPGYRKTQHSFLICFQAMMFSACLNSLSDWSGLVSARPYTEPCFYSYTALGSALEKRFVSACAMWILLPGFSLWSNSRGGPGGYHSAAPYRENWTRISRRVVLLRLQNLKTTFL